MAAPFPAPELVIFDIDGTLLATDRFWLDVGRRAVRTVFERRGIDRPLPDDRRFLGAIGLPMSEFWQFILPEDLHPLAGEIEDESEDLEEMAFVAGAGALYPGARRLMVDLDRTGVLLALASNCGRRYLDGFIRAFSLGPLLVEARCVDSPGIGSKADMVGDILRCTGVDRALMVGDRDSDRDAARAHGVPFVLFDGGFSGTPAAPGDTVVHRYEELRALLLADGRPTA